MDTNMTRARRGQTSFNAGQFRRKMIELGVSQTQLAEVSGLTQPAISAVLNLRAYAGASRVSRMQDALHQLALEIEAKKRAEATVQEEASTPSENPEERSEESPKESSARTSEPTPRATIRIRRL